MELEVLKIDGTKSGKKVTLEENVFAINPTTTPFISTSSSTSPTSVTVTPRPRIAARSRTAPRSSVARRAAAVLVTAP